MGQEVVHFSGGDDENKGNNNDSDYRELVLVVLVLTNPNHSCSRPAQ